MFWTCGQWCCSLLRQIFSCLLVNLLHTQPDFIIQDGYDFDPHSLPIMQQVKWISHSTILNLADMDETLPIAFNFFELNKATNLVDSRNDSSVYLSLVDIPQGRW